MGWFYWAKFFNAPFSWTRVHSVPKVSLQFAATLSIDFPGFPSGINCLQICGFFNGDGGERLCYNQ